MSKNNAAMLAMASMAMIGAGLDSGRSPAWSSWSPNKNHKCPDSKKRKRKAQKAARRKNRK